MNTKAVRVVPYDSEWPHNIDAIRREIERGGQVYYLHNRVETIDKCAARLQMLLGEDAAIGIAHGKMTQEAIDEVMSRMTDGELKWFLALSLLDECIIGCKGYTLNFPVKHPHPDDTWGFIGYEGNYLPDQWFV